MCALQKLTIENWDETTNKEYHLTFLNERNAIRGVLYDLLQLDNEIKCIKVEIQSLKANFDSQLEYLQAEVKRLQEDEYLEAEHKNKLLSELVKQIEKLNSTFSSEFEELQFQKEEKCRALSDNIEKLFQTKSQFKTTHKMQVESLKNFRVTCYEYRDLHSAIDVRMKSINRKFCDEMFYIASCEKNLKDIFALIDDSSSQSGTYSAASSAVEISGICAEFRNDFAWMRNEQITKRNELFDYFKENLANDLTAALAAMHVYQPEEPIKFIANYLKHLKQNHFRLEIQKKIYSAAEHGEELFPKTHEHNNS